MIALRKYGYKGVNTMYGAIVGDVEGSTYEFAGRKTKSFPLFEPNQ